MRIKRSHAIILAIIISSIFTGFIVSLAQQNSMFDHIPNEIKQYNYYKRFEWFHAPRVFPFDTISIHTYHRELKKESESRENNFQITNRNKLLNLPTWKHLGPIAVASGRYYSGRVRGVAVHPTNPNIVYIGAASGGLWKTTDGGSTWENLSDEFASNTFGAIAIDPNDPDVIYAGTGEVFAGGIYNIYDGRGLYKSTDAGATWTHITDGFGLITQFGDIEVSPHNSKIVFAALGTGYSHSRSFLNNKGVWRSEDAGLTWTRILEAKNSYNNSAGAYDIIIHPTDSNMVYAALGSSTPSGFYISYDKGQTWTLSNSGLPIHIERMQIAIAPTAPSMIYAVVYSTTYTPYRTKLFKSVDDGATWNEIAVGYEFGSNGSDQGAYDLCVAVHPDDENKLYVGNIILSQSTDGENFAIAKTGSQTHADFHKIVFAPSNHDIIYIGNDGGVFRSSDGGETWQDKNLGLSTLQLYMMASHPTNRDTVIAGSQDNGGFYTKNGGATYWTRYAGGDVTGVFYDHLNPDIAYTVLFWQTLYKSLDGGIVFQTRIGRDFDRYLEGFFLIHPTKPNWLYCAKDKKVIRSEDGGTSWTPISSELTKWPFYSMDQSHINPNMMILASWGINLDNPQVMISTDEGYNWHEVTDNIPGEPRFITKVVAHPTDENTMFVVRSGYGSDKIYRSTDLGTTWKDITNGLPDIPHSDLFIDPQNPYHYYAANDFGVYASFNGGLSWQRYSDGIPFIVANDFDYFNYGGDRLLRVATYGRGVYELDLDDVNVTDLALAGTIHYYSNDNPIINGMVNLNEYCQATDSQGDFAFIDIPEHDYILKPSKAGDLYNGISAFDASLILRNVVGTISLTPFQMIAADVTGNGEVSAPDASHILRKVVGLVDKFPVGNDWTFVPTSFQIDSSNWKAAPDSMLYRPLKSIQFDQDFKGIVYGDVSGNWSPQNFQTAFIPKQIASSVKIELGEIDIISPSEFELTIQLNGDVEIHSAEIDLEFNPEDFKLQNIKLSEKIAGVISEYVLNRGELHIAIASANPITIADNLIKLNCKHLNDRGKKQSGIHIKSAIVNEIAINIQQSKQKPGENPEIPAKFALFQSYPNPFNSETTIRYQLPQAGYVELKIYNLVGSEIRKLVSHSKKAGSHSILWDGRDGTGNLVSSGIYFYRIEVRSIENPHRLWKDVKKMILMK